MVLHPDEPVEAATVAALGVGVALFMGATVASYWRVRREVLIPRSVVTLASVGALAFVVGTQPVWPLSIVAVGLAVVAFLEREPRAGRSRRPGSVDVTVDAWLRPFPR
jgi:hypothetical protein